MIKFIVRILVISSFVLVQGYVFGQEFAEVTFNDRRVINSHSVEMLEARKLDFRTSHRFGDLLGTSGGWQSFYGLENAADIGIGFDYGINDNINIGISRTKGSGELRMLVNTFFKARLMRQQIKGNNPLSITFLSTANISTMNKTEADGFLSSFPKFSNRLAYHLEIIFARKFSPKFSLQASLNYTYRDIVFQNDQNDLPSIGIASRIRFTKATALIFDATIPVLDNRKLEQTYFPPIGIGLEFNTGVGHIFQINLTNATGLAETDYIPYSYSDWTAGEFRLGFTIARKFTLY
jgi:hypothetical protein